MKNEESQNEFFTAFIFCRVDFHSGLSPTAVRFVLLFAWRLYHSMHAKPCCNTLSECNFPQLAPWRRVTQCQQTARRLGVITDSVDASSGNWSPAVAGQGPRERTASGPSSLAFVAGRGSLGSRMTDRTIDVSLYVCR